MLTCNPVRVSVGCNSCVLSHPEMGSYVPDRSDNCQADRDFVNARGVIRIDCDVEGLHLATGFSEVGGLSEDWGDPY